MFSASTNAGNLNARCALCSLPLLVLNDRHQIALVELILPFMEYMEAKRYYTDAKAKQRALHRRVQTLQQKNQPMHDFKKRLETRLKRLNEQRDGKKEAAKRRFKAMKAKWDENEKLVY
jgi:structural maintenance of chromosomes protein 5